MFPLDRLTDLRLGAWRGNGRAWAAASFDLPRLTAFIRTPG
jgi:hypothetical protein